MWWAFRSKIGRLAFAAIAAGFLCLGAARQATAGLDQWTAIGPPGEAQINAVLVALSLTGVPTLYVATPHGIFWTSNGGGSWMQTTTDSQGRALEPILSLSYDRTFGLVVAGAANRSRIYFGGLGGTSWLRRTVDTSGAASQIYGTIPKPISEDMSEVTAATNDGLWRSGDTGDSFEAYRGLPGCTDVRAAAIDRQHPETRYAGTDCGLFRTTDGTQATASWTKVEQRVFDLTGGGSHLVDMIGSNVTAVTLGPSNPDNVFAGTQSGAIFKIQPDGIGGLAITPMTRTNGFAPAPVEAIALDPQLLGVIYAGTAGQGVFKGKTAAWGRWLPFNAGLGNLEVTSLAIDGSNSRKLYAGTANGVYAIEQSSVLPPAADLALHATATADQKVPATGLHRQIIQIDLANRGPGAATSAKVTIEFLTPLGKRLATGSVTVNKLASTPGRCDEQLVSCGIGPVAVGAGARLTLSLDPARALRGQVLLVKATAQGTVANDVWGIPDAHPADNTIRLRVPIN
jgi:hypothetical protein